MNWKIPGDTTEPIITAQKHIRSAHGNPNAVNLPKTCVLFEMGMAIPFLEENFPTETILEHIPGFITDEKCIRIAGQSSVGFIRGGYGAPAAVDTLETILALGVRRVIVAGMCGGFSPDIEVGDVVIPREIYCEEGTSQHYLENIEHVSADSVLQQALAEHYEKYFHVLQHPTVTTDAVYRQTIAKEAGWRSKGCVGVDMEASALLAVCQYYGVPSCAALICSDRHPLPNEVGSWNWGNVDFKEKRKKFVRHCVAFASETDDL